MNSTARASSILILCAISALGCRNFVVLEAPFNAELIGLDDEASPRFTWDTARAISPEYSVAYRLAVYTDGDLDGEPVLERQSLDVREYQPGATEGWLPGDAEYFWKVEADLRDPTGTVVDSLGCQNPRSFYLDRRPLVPVDLRFPDEDGLSDLQVLVGLELFGPTPSIELEHGERRTLSISFRAGDEELRVQGSISAIGYTEQLKYENVVVEDVTAEELRAAAAGTPLERVYQLGDDPIVRLSLY
jgi:hypothetical protein